MEEQSFFYPVQIVSRAVTRKRLRRAVSYLTLSTAFGIGCLSALSPLPGPSSFVSATAPAQPAPLPPAAPVEPVELAQGFIPDPIKPEAPSTEKSYPVALSLKVTGGDTLIDLLTNAGVSYDEAQHAITSMRPVYDPRKLDVGQSVALQLDKNPDGADPLIASLSLSMSPTATLEVTRRGGDFKARKLDIPTERKLARIGGRIDGSLYETAVEAGLPVSMVQDIINAYSYDIDFQRDIKSGDKVEVMFERIQTREGVKVGTGNLVFTQLDLRGKTLKIYRYVDKSGNADYYNEKGESVRKALLRTPINGARITSAFGMRNHPLLGYSKMHRGVDFGAATGTPIYAAGDGVVEMAGTHGGYGNYLRIRHNAKYASAYGHTSRFAKGVKPGVKVKQGQVVAYVGSTGMSTGPHLHYEILVNNEQVNPAGIKFKTGAVLAGKELAAFKQNMKKIESQMAELPRGEAEVAMAQTPEAKTAN